MIKYLSILHMAKNILRKQFGNMYGKNQPFEVQESPKPTLPPIESPTFTIPGIVLFTFLVFLCMMLYLNREDIITFFKRIFTDFNPGDKIDELEEKYNDLTKNSKFWQDITNRLDQNEKENKKEPDPEKEKNPEIESKLDSIQTRLDSMENNPSLDSKLNFIQNRLDSMEQNSHRHSDSQIDPTLLNNIQQRLDTMGENSPSQNNQNVNASQSESIPDKHIKTIEQMEKNRKETEKQIEKGGVNQMGEKLSLYRKDQIANYNGFCYIGYDNKRECTNVYEGDICMSGQIFPTMEICVNPTPILQREA